MADQSSLRAVDLFCGAGGFSAGFSQVGYEIAFAIDINEDAAETFQLNHAGARVEQASIIDLDPSDIATAAAGVVDVVIGGPSCQGFSTARKDRWNDKRSEQNQLWKHMLKVVEVLRPRAFILENVPGMLLWKEGNFGGDILSSFRSLGYTVADPKILLAADFGVPQLRRRLFIVGLLGDSEFRFPEPTHIGGWRRDTQGYWAEKQKESNLPPHISLWDAIGDLPMLEGSLGEPVADYAGVKPTPFIRRMRRHTKKVRDHQVRSLHPDHLDLIRHVPIGGTWRDIPRHLLPDRFRGMRRTDSSNVLGRLDPTRPAYTITTKFNNVTSGCFVHPFEDRTLSLREGARLQTFPDSYRFAGSLTSGYRQVGNAVPPHLAAVLAEAIAQQIDAGSRLTAHTRPIRPAKTPLPEPAASVTRTRMKRQKRTDTAPEVLLRKEIDKAGVTYETDVRPLSQLNRKADIVFRRERLAVFVDGCFWHGCPEHTRPTKSNTRWWADKIQANRERDADTTEHLLQAGWRVVRIWEHSDPADAAIVVLDAVGIERASQRLAVS